MIDYTSVAAIIGEAQKTRCRISEVILKEQSESLQVSRDILFNRMSKQVDVMKQSVADGLTSDRKSYSGLSGGDAVKFAAAMKNGSVFGGTFLGKIISRALAVAERNACMGKIVAAPTAGSCGILPAVLFTYADQVNKSDNQIVMSMFTAAAFGMVLANRSSISGAQGGCQAECGSAAAMAAAAAVELLDGSPVVSGNAFSIALKNMLGLVCDPVCGLVEVPCVKRNATSAACASAAVEMAMAGIESRIPADEVIDAMKEIGDAMPRSLKETAEAGLASTPTAAGMSKKLGY